MDDASSWMAALTEAMPMATSAAAAATAATLIAANAFSPALFMPPKLRPTFFMTLDAASLAMIANTA